MKEEIFIFSCCCQSREKYGEKKIYMFGYLSDYLQIASVHGEEFTVVLVNVDVVSGSAKTSIDSRLDFVNRLCLAITKVNI
jgi:hypothetical protein